MAGLRSGYAPVSDLLRHPAGARRRALREAHRVLQGRSECEGDRRPARGRRPPARAGEHRSGRAPPGARPPPPPHPRDLPAAALRRLTSGSPLAGDLHSVVVHVDGGARGNPGPAAAAAVATTPEGEELAESSAYLGEVTNNVAEYRAVLLGLELARSL